MAIGGLLNLPKELFIGVPLFVASCQSYDGGVGPIPFVESHGGYTFCGLASLCIMQSHNLLDLCALRVMHLHNFLSRTGSKKDNWLTRADFKGAATSWLTPAILSGLALAAKCLRRSGFQFPTAPKS